MKIDKRLFLEGIIKYWNFNIDESIPLKEQEYELSEDLIQVEYSNSNKIIDVGWYPEFDVNGQFVICIIQGQDWDNPIEKYFAKSTSELFDCICNLIKKITTIT